MSQDSCANLVLMPCIFVLLLNNYPSVHLFSSSTPSLSSPKHRMDNVHGSNLIPLVNTVIISRIPTSFTLEYKKC